MKRTFHVYLPKEDRRKRKRLFDELDMAMTVEQTRIPHGVYRVTLERIGDTPETCRDESDNAGSRLKACSRA